MSLTSHLTETDPLIATALANEVASQESQIELIASENIVIRAVLDALGHQMIDKTLEGAVPRSALSRRRPLRRCG